MTKSLNQVDATYYRLLQDIMTNGIEKGDRTGTGTISVFGRQVHFNCRDGKIPLLTTKKIKPDLIISELLWFLQGRTDLRWLLEHDNKIWVGDAFKRYLKETSEYKGNHPDTKEEFIDAILTDDEFSRKWGDLGPIYGKQWRKWTQTILKKSKDGIPIGYSVNFIDQFQNLINDLRINPDSRRLMVTAWQPAEISDMTLPPCHHGFQVWTRELTEEERLNLIQDTGIDVLKHEARDKFLEENNIPTRAISLSWNQRSVDTPLGLPFNIASYGILLHLIGKIVNMIPEDLIGNLGDTHIYQNQLDGVKEQLRRGSACEVPTLKINDEFWLTETQECGTGKLSENLDSLFKSINIEDFSIKDYTPHNKIKFPLSN